MEGKVAFKNSYQYKFKMNSETASDVCVLALVSTVFIRFNFVVCRAQISCEEPAKVNRESERNGSKMLQQNCFKSALAAPASVVTPAPALKSAFSMSRLRRSLMGSLSFPFTQMYRTAFKLPPR